VESPVLNRVQNSTYHLDHFSGGLPDLVIKCLRKTIASIKAQSNDNYDTWVATNDVYQVSSSLGDFDINYVDICFNRPYHPWNIPGADKAKKRLCIASEIEKEVEVDAEALICFLDADDLVHKDLVDFIVKMYKPGFSYLFSNGYIFDYTNGDLILSNKFHKACASCFVGGYQKNELPREVPITNDYSDIRALGGVFLDKFYDARSDRAKYDVIVTEFPGFLYTRGNPEQISNDSERNRIKANYFGFNKKSKVRSAFSKCYHMLRRARYKVTGLNEYKKGILSEYSLHDHSGP